MVQSGADGNLLLQGLFQDGAGGKEVKAGHSPLLVPGGREEAVEAGGGGGGGVLELELRVVRGETAAMDADGPDKGKEDNAYLWYQLNKFAQMGPSWLCIRSRVGGSAT